MGNVRPVIPPPRSHSRAPSALLVAAVLAAALLAALPAPARADGPFCLHKRLAIVAHQDDDLIFQNPGLLEAIEAGDCVRTVFVTAGDAGLGTAYWQEREEGSRAAYAVMAGVANSWTTTKPSVAGHTVRLATLTGKPTVSQVYLRLPNGGQNGNGYAATEFKSLPKLWRSHNPQPSGLTPITEISALDGSATYTYESLLATLQALIEEFEPEVISTQDFIHEFGTGDHADHIAVAKLTQIAANAWASEHVLRSYMDYESKNFSINVLEPQLAKKLSAYYAYAVHDSNEACASQIKCEEPLYSDYWAWLKRQIVLSESSVPGADAGPDQAVASKAAVTLDGSASSDPLGHSLSYEWKQTGGTTVTLSNSHAVKPTFTAPTGPSTLTFSLVVKSAEASSAADTVAVAVAAPNFALTVTTSGNGSGTVTSSPAGISCPNDCEEAYEQGTKVTLTPSPAGGSEFKGWSGSCSGTGSCEVTMSAAKSVGAEFALQRHTLSVTKTGTGSGTVTSSPAGISCGGTCSASFDHGTEVTLSASPAAGSSFVKWTGACTGTGACKVTMSAAKSVGAGFALVPKFALTVSTSGNGSGTVTSSPAGISCPNDCEEAYEQGTKVTLTPSPAAGSEFKGWSGACTGAGSCEVSMSAAKSVGAEFALQRHQLSVSKSGTGTGTVTSTPAGIECGATCSASFNHGTLVTLSGAPGANTKAVSWQSCPGTVNGSNQCEVTMSAAKSASAVFSLESRQLSVTKNGSGTGTVTSSPAGISCGPTCSASLEHGTVVTLTGAPGVNTKAVVWQSCPGTVNGSNQCEVTMSAAKEAVASFNLEQRQLTVTKGGTGSGTVSSSPAGINCGVTCSTNFDHGTVVKLSGNPAAGSKAVAWSGCDKVRGSNECEVTMSAVKAVSATFDLEVHQLSVSKSGTGTGTVTSTPTGIECGSTCSAGFDHGAEVTLAASPSQGSFFVKWTGACTGAGSCEVTMSAAKSVGAEFALVPKFALTASTSGNGSGTVTSSPAGISCPSDCEAIYEQGTKVTLTPSPAAGSEFRGWTGPCSGSGTCEVTMAAAKSVEAEFVLQRHQLSVTKGGSGSGTVTSSPAGIGCGSTCSANFDHGTLVKLSGNPAAGSKAVAWSGCDKVNASNECEVTMSAVKAVSATFDLEVHQLIVSKSGTGTGTVTSSPAGISCGATCSASFNHGTLVTLTGAPGANTETVSWQTCPGTVNGSNQCEVTVSAAKEAVATFDLEQRQLTVERNGNGSGTVASSPAGIECGSACAADFAHGTSVKLIRTPAPGSKAVAWSGCDTVNGAGECEVTMSGARTVTATFQLETHQLAVTKNGTGAGTVTSSPAGIECGATCNASFDEGTLVKLSGAPDVGSKPASWSGCDEVNGSDQCVVTMSEVESVTATFDLEAHVLGIEVTGSGSGTVTSSPTGIACDSDCQGAFLHGTVVTLTGTSDPGTKPVGWESCPGTVNGSNQCEVTVDEAKQARASFELESHRLRVDKSGADDGATTVMSSPAGIDCGGICATTFDHGTEVTLAALPSRAGAVVWSGCDEIVGDNECRVAMDADKGVSARLEAVPSPPITTPTPPPAPTPTPPNTKLLKAKIANGTARFAFAAEGSASRYRCALAKPGKKLVYRPCTSPVTYRNLSPGRYVFKVEALGPDGSELAPLTRRFRVRAGE